MAGKIRQSIDIPSLERYIDRNVPAIQTPLVVKQFGYGQSNPTYLLESVTSGLKVVLRKKPPGKLLSKTAHQVDREYRVLHALGGTDLPVPRTYCLCEDDSVIGTPFYVMEYLDGRVIEDPALPAVSPAERWQMWHSAVTTLAELHRISPRSVNLETFGRAAGFYGRQVKTFRAVSEAQAKTVDVDTKKAVGNIPHFEDMCEFFADPKSEPRDRSGLIHGDFKIDNLVFHRTEPRVIGILDWEMSTIGHPLSDLANLLTPFVTSRSELARAIGRGSTAFLPDETPGLPTKAQCIAWYRDTAGWDPSCDMAWGDAFGVFRGSIIMQGIAARQALRQASSERAMEYGRQSGPFGLVAWELVGECKRRMRSRL